MTSPVRNRFPDQTDDAFQQELLKSVNDFRARHGVPALTIDPQLVTAAKARAQVVSTYNQLDENHQGRDPNLGENLYWGASGSSQPAPATDATKSWYGEIIDYNFATAAANPGAVTGHFTQLVWKGTTTIGAARVSGQGPSTTKRTSWPSSPRPETWRASTPPTCPPRPRDRTTARPCGGPPSTAAPGPRTPCCPATGPPPPPPSSRSAPTTPRTACTGAATATPPSGTPAGTPTPRSPPACRPPATFQQVNPIAAFVTSLAWRPPRRSGRVCARPGAAARRRDAQEQPLLSGTTLSAA
jgi:hypothetical protein